MGKELVNNEVLRRGKRDGHPIEHDAIRAGSIACRSYGVWGIAALLWLATGLARLLGGTEKPTTYYVHNDVFRLKMALFVAVLLLEIWPMVTLIRWRTQIARGMSVRTEHARALARISVVEAALVVAMVFAATAMARGYGF